jgi:hypothetical protein
MGLGSGLISESRIELIGGKCRFDIFYGIWMEFGFWEVRLEVEEEFGISGKLMLFY